MWLQMRLHPAIVLEETKECDATASEQTRKKTTLLMLGCEMLRVLLEVYKHTCCMSCAATRSVKVAHDNNFGDNKCGQDSGDCQLGVIRGGVQKIGSHQAAKYVSERTVRHHVSLQESSQWCVTSTGVAST